MGSASMCAKAGASASSTLPTPSSLAAASAAALQPCPATRTCTSAPIALAAVSALAVASLSDLLSCSAISSVGIMCLGTDNSSDRPGLVLELVEKLGDAFDFDAGLARRRL